MEESSSRSLNNFINLCNKTVPPHIKDYLAKWHPVEAHLVNAIESYLYPERNIFSEEERKKIKDFLNQDRNFEKVKITLRNSNIPVYDEKAFDCYQKAAPFLKNANDCYERKNYNEAITFCTQAITEYSSHAIAYNLRAISYFQQGKTTEAKNDFQKVIELNPENVIPYNNMIALLSKEKEYAEALTYSNKFPKDDVLATEDVYVYLVNRAELKILVNRDYASAKEDLDLVKKIYPHTDKLATKISQLLNQIRDPQLFAKIKAVRNTSYNPGTFGNSSGSPTSSLNNTFDKPSPSRSPK